MLKFVSSGILSEPYINIFKNFALQTQEVMQSDHLSVLVFGRQMLGKKNIVFHIFSIMVTRVTRHIADKPISNC